MIRHLATPFLFALIVSLPSRADAREIVHLKNGSVIKGLILEQIPGQNLKIQTRDGSVFVYAMDEVVKIAKEEAASPIMPAPVPPEASAQIAMSPTVAGAGAGSARPGGRPFSVHLRSGFNFPGRLNAKGSSYELYACGSTMCRDTYRDTEKIDIEGNFSFLASMEYQAHPKLALGAGTGYYTIIAFTESDDDDLDDLGNVWPLFGSLRFTPMVGGFSPFALLKSGYNFFLPGPNSEFDDDSPGEEIETSGGFFWGLGAGIIWNLLAIPYKLSLEGLYTVSRISWHREYHDPEDATYEAEDKVEVSVPRFGILAGVAF